MKTVETRCQSCGAKVKVLANTPYNGILCSSCSTPKTFRTKTTSNKEKEKILRKVNKTYNQLKEKHKELKMEGCNLSVRIFRDELLKYIKSL